MAKRTTKSTGANLGFEAQLWAAADALRNNMDAAEYKHVVLGLIFLKYISDAFEAKHAQLEAERAGGADRLEYVLVGGRSNHGLDPTLPREQERFPCPREIQEPGEVPPEFLDRHDPHAPTVARRARSFKPYSVQDSASCQLCRPRPLTPS